MNRMRNLNFVLSIALLLLIVFDLYILLEIISHFSTTFPIVYINLTIPGVSKELSVVFIIFIITLLLSQFLQRVNFLRKITNYLMKPLTVNQRIHTRIIILGILITFFTPILILSERYSSCFCIMGFDSPYYIYVAELFLYYGPKVLIGRDKISVALLSSLILNITKSLETTGVFLPFILGVIYALTSFYITYILTKRNVTISTLVGACTALTFHFIRLTYDLYGQLLANALLLLVLYSESKLLKSQKVGKELIKTTMLLVFLALTHFWTTALALLFTALVIIFLIAKEIYLNHRLTYKAKLYVVFLAPFIIIGLVMIMYRRDVIFWFFGVMEREFNFFTFSLDWFWVLGGEYFVVWPLSMLGTVYLFREDKDFATFISSWIVYLVALMFITGYAQSYRFTLLMPVHIFLGFGIYASYDLLKNAIENYLKTIKPRTTKLLSLLFVSAIILLLINHAIARVYIPAYTYRPSEGALKQMYEVRDLIGFENNSAIVLVYPPKLKASYYWPIMIIGSNVYFGTLEDLANEKKDIRGKSYPDWKNKTIILCTELYPFSRLEYLISEQIKDGIYKLIIKDPNIWETILISNASWIDYSFNDTFKISKDSTLNVTFSLGDGLLINVEPGDKGSLTLVYNLTEKLIIGKNASRVVIKANSSSTNFRISIILTNGSHILCKKTWRLNNNLQKYILELIDHYQNYISSILVKIERTTAEEEYSKIFIKYILII